MTSGSKTRLVGGGIIIGCILLALSLYATRNSFSYRVSPNTTLASPYPSIFIYVVDTLRADHLSTYGYFRDTSPELTKFAEDAILFENAYAQCSWTKPSVSCMYTGKFPSSHGAMTRNGVLPAEHTTLPEWLKSIGYYTAGFVSNYNLYTLFGFSQGFEHYKEYPYDLSEDKSFVRAEVINDDIEEFLSDHPSESTFLYIHTMDPHAPCIPKPPFNRKFRDIGPSLTIAGVQWPINMTINAYDGEIAYSDFQFGKFLTILKKHNRYHNSLIFFLSDHGEEIGEHGREGHGYTLFEEVTHIPFFLKLPNEEGGGRREPQPIRTIDIYPTIRDLISEADDTSFDGASFRSLIKLSQEKWNPVMYAEEQLDGYNLRSLVFEGFKLIERTTPTHTQMLFNTETDTSESHDLVSSLPQQAQVMEQYMNTITSSLNNNYQIDCFNRVTLSATHTIAGQIKIVGGHFVETSALGLLPEEQFQLAPDNTAFSFTVHLRNVANPNGNPDLIVAKRSFFFSSDTPNAILELNFTLDKNPLPSSCLALGLTTNPVQYETLPLRINLQDERMIIGLSGTRPFFEERDRPTIRISRLAPVKPAQTFLEQESEDILNALGYLK